MQRLESGQWDSEPSFNTVLFQIQSGSAYGFTVTFGLVVGVYESSCSTWHMRYVIFILKFSTPLLQKTTKQ
jgi:hypothetical protein